MCSLTPSAALSAPELDPATVLAVGELVQAAAHQFGRITGPVPYQVLTDHTAADLARYLGDTEAFDA